MGLIDNPLGQALGRVLDAVLPDPEANRQAKAQAFELMANGTFDQRTEAAQAAAIGEAMKADATSQSPFQRGWRPAAGWVAVSGLAVHFVGLPVASWVASMAGHTLPPLALDVQTLIGLLTTLLGLGGMRSMERIKGAA